MADKIAHPSRHGVGLVGGGVFPMLVGNLPTAVKYRLPIKVIVIKNNTLGKIKWEQMVFLGNPEYGCELHPIDFAAFARACGGIGLTITEPAACGDILGEALQAPGPVLVEAVVDPFEPPMPAKIKPKQALHFAKSLARGQPKRMKIATTIFEDRVRELV